MNVNKIAPEMISLGPMSLGFVKLGITPGGGGRSGSRRMAGFCKAASDIDWVMVWSVLVDGKIVISVGRGDLWRREGRDEKRAA